MERLPGRAVVVGAVAALTGFAGTSTVVLAGLDAAGATPRQAGAGLVALCVTQGAGMIVLSRRYRQPITLAWSTPGAALLVSAGHVAGSWRAAVGAFVVAALLTAVIAASAHLSRLVASIPAPLAQAMLAGILLPICLRPVSVVVAAPAVTLPVVASWIVVLCLAPRWATPAAFLVAILVVGVVLRGGGQRFVIPVPELTLPHFSLAAVVGLSIPLVVVTMAAQNVPGAAVMSAQGYDVPWRPVLLTTAVGSLVGAFAGGHAINLAAISAALPASEEAHRDPTRRWAASTTCGWLYLCLGGLAPLVAALLSGRAAEVVAVVAGLALLPTLASATSAALHAPGTALPAVVTIVVGASSLTLFGVGPALWSLLIGLVLWAALVRRRQPEMT
jgi:benzoate membrane transport protein